MFRSIGRMAALILSTVLTALVIAGIALLIWLDIASDLQEARPGNAPDPIARIFRDVSSITFFIQRPLAGTAYEITTGAAFDTPAAVAAEEPESQWCYVSIEEDGLTSRLDLGKRTGRAAPEFYELTGLAPEVWSRLGITREGLEASARKDCVFRGFDPREAGS